MPITVVNKYFSTFYISTTPKRSKINRKTPFFDYIPSDFAVGKQLIFSSVLDDQSRPFFFFYFSY